MRAAVLCLVAAVAFTIGVLTEHFDWQDARVMTHILGRAKCIFYSDSAQ